MQRRDFFCLATGAAALAVAPGWAATALPRVEVFKTASCGCCGAWVEHMQGAGFPVHVTVVEDTSGIRQRQGIPQALGSCHTAVVEGYALEGHVPATDVKKLLARRPVAAGLAVPGMPAGAPGMEMEPRKDAFRVLLVDKAGGSTVFASYPKS